MTNENRHQRPGDGERGRHQHRGGQRIGDQRREGQRGESQRGENQRSRGDSGRSDRDRSERRFGQGDRKPRSFSQQRPSQRARTSDSARLAAWEVLRQVRENDAYANLVAPKILREANLHGRDASFATELSFGTLRLQGRYDWIIDECLDRPQIDAKVRDVLRLGAHQLLGMRVPTHAAVSETVALARTVIGAGPAQLVNAVLRRISEVSAQEWLERIGALEQKPTAVLAIEHSHPEWIVRSLQQSLAWHGRDVAELPQLLAAHNTPAAVTLVARPGIVTDDELENSQPARYAPTAHVLQGGDPGRIEAVRQARAGVQDEGSQLVALALDAAPLAGSDQTWLDLCAGPGGKTALLAALLGQKHTEGKLIANEVAPHRATLVEQASVAAPIPVEVVVGDGREIDGNFDRILVDAPCTGLGALRRRPEARWRRTPQDLAQLAVLQRELLTAAMNSTRPGGVVAYVTCSPHIAETVVVVEDVLKKFPSAQLLDAPQILNSVTKEPIDAGTGKYVQLWPHLHGTDGMFLSLIQVGE